MPLDFDDIDALLAFLDRQWMSEPVQRAYDKLAAERGQRQAAEARLGALEQRLRAAADERAATGGRPAEDPDADEAPLPTTSRLASDHTDQDPEH